LLEEEVMPVVGMEANSGLNVSLPFATTTPNFNFFQRTRHRFPFTCANQNQDCSNLFFKA